MSIKLKEDKPLKFTFETIVETEEYEINKLEVSSNNLIDDYITLPYEKYKIIEYFYNFHRDRLKTYKSGKPFFFGKRVFLETSLQFFKRLRNNIFKSIPEVYNFRLSNLEKKVSKLESIQKLMKKMLDNDCHIELNIRQLAATPDYCELMYNEYVTILDSIDKWLKDQDPAALEKAYYIKNLETYFEMIGKQRKGIKKLAEAVLIGHIKLFNDLIPEFEFTTTHFSRILNTKVIAKDLPVIIFYTCLERISNIKNNGYTRLITMCYKIIRGCFKKFDSQDEFISCFIPAMTPSTLTMKDFQHIPQVNYIKNILQNGLKTRTKGINILLYGKPGCGKTSLARTLIEEINAKGFEVVSSDFNEKYDAVESALNTWGGRLNIRDNLSDNEYRFLSFTIMSEILKGDHNSVILYDEAEDCFRRRDIVSQSKGRINELLEKNVTPVIWTTNSLSCMEESYFRRFTYILNVETLPANSYIDTLVKIADKYDIPFSDSLKRICLQYKPSAGIVEKAFRNFILTGSKDIKDLKQDLLDTLKGENFGNPITKNKVNINSFNPDLINASVDLKELAERIKSSGRLDFSMLLSGCPGASKTSFGRYLAEQLHLKVLNKTYADLASCWVGETEHNIQKLFDEAEREKALIIIDEADILLKDRTQAEKSWEISQTEALLTCMEDHPYPVIFTTNLYDNLDPAAMRRILYKVKHDYLRQDQLKLAFKHFFNMKITENLRLSKLTAGDFVVVKKQAEFQDRLNDKEWLINALTEEMNQKKMQLDSPTINI